MAKITVPVNSAGGNSGPIKNRVYERKKVPNKSFGIEIGNTYLLKRTGISEYDAFPEDNETIAANPFNLLFKTDGSSFGISGSVITFYDTYQENGSTKAFYVVYDIENDVWLKEGSTLYQYDTPLTEDDYAHLMLSITSNTYIFDVQLLASIITEADGSPFYPKTYTVENILVEDKIDDLKNWFYENGGIGLLNVPRWDQINFDDHEVSVYEDATNEVYISIERYSSFGSSDSVYTVYVETKDKEYYITSYENEWYTRDELYEPVLISLAPDIELDLENVVSGQHDLFRAIYGVKETLLKHKFKMIDDAIDKEINGMILKNKIYDNIEQKELVNGNMYSFKENCSRFFAKYDTVKDIYNIFGNVVLDQVQQAEPSQYSEPAQSYDEPAQLSEETIFYIGYKEQSSKGYGATTHYIEIETNYTTYYYYEDGDGWQMSSSMRSLADNSNMPPKLEYNSEYVEDMNMLLDILNLTTQQTLGEKFSEGIKNWNYEKGETQQKLIYDMESVFTLDYLDLIDEAELVPESGSIQQPLYYDMENNVGLLYNAILAGEIYELTYTYGAIGQQGFASWYYTCVVTFSDPTNIQFNWTYTDNGNTNLIESQDDMPTIDYKETNVMQGINPQLVSNLIATIENGISLEAKVKDLQNWEYETKEGSLTNGSSYTVKETISFDDLPISDMTIYEDYSVAVGKIASISISNNFLLVHLQEEPNTMAMPFVYNISTNTWLDDVYQYLPQLTYNSSATTSNDNYLKKILEGAGDITISLKEKFETCLSLERLINVEIPVNSLVSDSTYSTYGYNYKATIQDDAFIDALKVEIVYTLAQIDSENFCPIQDIDTTNGTLTLYVKQNSGNIVLNRIDIFKNVK